MHPTTILRPITWAGKGALTFVLGEPPLVLKAGTTGLRAIKGGTSAGSAPTYNATTGDYTIDGSVVWLAEGSSNNDSILDYVVWNANRRFALGYWAVNTVPTTMTFTIVRPDAPGTYTSGEYLMNHSKIFLSEVAGMAAARVARNAALVRKTYSKDILNRNQMSFTRYTQRQTDYLDAQPQSRNDLATQADRKEGNEE